MRLWVKYMYFTCCLLYLCVGCSPYNNFLRTDESANDYVPDDFTEEQLIEIYDSDGVTLFRQIMDASTIMEYTKAHSNANMKEVVTIPQEAQKVIVCKIYAKTDEYFVKLGVPLINETEEVLYQDDDNYYLSYQTEAYLDETATLIMYQVDHTLGEYLISLASEKDAIYNKEEILKSWETSHDK
ncbi:MAG: hypothetical protein Q4E86_00255 [Lachnospiraceae bacterium]|nr:hypothetical protein [Lachnospiraceae bacterium]